MKKPSNSCYIMVTDNISSTLSSQRELKIGHLTRMNWEKSKINILNRATKNVFAEKLLIFEGIVFLLLTVLADMLQGFLWGMCHSVFVRVCLCVCVCVSLLYFENAWMIRSYLTDTIRYKHSHMHMKNWKQCYIVRSLGRTVGILY